MEEMASLWSYQETLDEMRQKLLYKSLELEQLKVEKYEEMRKKKEYVKQLIQVLNMVCQERDEAKEQLQKLVNQLSHVQVDNSPLLKATKANSSITESNSLSETYNYQSPNSSPVESFFDAVSSLEFSNNNMADSNAVSYDCTVDNCVPQLVPKVDDQATLVIDNLVKGKILPQKGKLLKSIIEAGPLLQTLLVSGQLPQWRNPPQLKTFNIPPVSIKGFEGEIANQNLGSRSLQTQPYFEMSCGSSQMLSTSMLNLANSGYVSCLENQSLISAGPNINSFVLGKRQRLQ